MHLSMLKRPTRPTVDKRGIAVCLLNPQSGRGVQVRSTLAYVLVVVVVAQQLFSDTKKSE